NPNLLPINTLPVLCNVALSCNSSNTCWRGCKKRWTGLIGKTLPEGRVTLSTSIVSMKHITKTFPGTIANDQIDLDLFPSEIHVIMGENGAGKTTLMNVLYGMYRPDSGEIYVDGKQAKIRSPVDAQALGIGMVFQHFSLIEVFTVLENFAIGRKGGKVRLNLSELESRIEDAERGYGISVDLNRKVQQLSIAEKQK